MKCWVPLPLHHHSPLSSSSQSNSQSESPVRLIGYVDRGAYRAFACDDVSVSAPRAGNYLWKRLLGLKLDALFNHLIFNGRNLPENHRNQFKCIRGRQLVMNWVNRWRTVGRRSTRQMRAYSSSFCRLMAVKCHLKPKLVKCLIKLV